MFKKLSLKLQYRKMLKASFTRLPETEQQKSFNAYNYEK